MRIKILQPLQNMSFFSLLLNKLLSNFHQLVGTTVRHVTKSTLTYHKASTDIKCNLGSRKETHYLHVKFHYETPWSCS